MEIIRTLKLLDDNLLVKAHVDELLDCIAHQVVVDKLVLAILPDLIQDRFTQLR